MLAASQQTEAVPLDESGMWIVNDERCSAKHFRSSEVANQVAQHYVTWMREICPTSQWEIQKLPDGMMGSCIPHVIDTTARDVFDRSGEKVGWERLHGSVMTNEKGTPVGVLVFDHDGLEGTERFFTIDGKKIGEQSVGW